MEHRIYGDLSIRYPKPYSLCLRGTVILTMLSISTNIMAIVVSTISNVITSVAEAAELTLNC